MRIDAYLFENRKYPSRTKASEAILRGEIKVNDKIVTKPSYDVKESDNIVVSDLALNFVSNGGYKLEKALSEFSVNVYGKTFCDVGASTGGFTDCLLRRGASKVFTVDVGESLLSDQLKKDDRVVIIDNFNARYLTIDVLGDFVDGVVCDVSFISLTYVLKPIYNILKDDGFAITLIKPQFEVGKKAVNKNGIVTKIDDRIFAVKKICDFGVAIGLYPKAITAAPLLPDKNVEYLVLWSKNKVEKVTFEKIKF